MPLVRRHERRPPTGRLSQEMKVLLAAAFISDTGGGLTFPFLLIYLHQVRHIGLAAAGFLIGGVFVGGLPAGAAAGALVDRIGPRPVATGCLCLQAIGTASLTLVRGPASAIIPVAILGLGSGAAWPAWFAILGVAARDQQARPRVFALSFQLLNLGLGVGSVIGGFVVQVSDPSTFVTVYLVDAATTLLVVPVLAALPASVFARASPDHTGPAGRGGYRRMFAHKQMRRLLISLGVLALGGYGAVNTAFVGFATSVVHVTPRTISLAFAANTAFIVCLQPLGLRAAGRMRRTRALTIVAAFFGVSWAVLALAGLWPRSLGGDALCVLTAVVFAAGEILLSPVQSPLANDLAPEGMAGRYNAATATIYSLTNVICPMFAGAMLGDSLGYWLLLLLSGFCLAAAAGFGWLRDSLTPAQDHAAGAIGVAA